MNISKLKKAVLTLGLGVGLAAGVSTSAVAYKPGYFSYYQCQQLQQACQRGDAGSCWMYNTSNCSQ